MSALDSLLTLNPWAEPVWAECRALADAAQSRLAAAQFDPAARRTIHDARTPAAVQRVRSGAGAWNRWAIAMLEWAAEKPMAPDAAALWHALARADFSQTRWDGGLDVAGFVFPGAASWRAAAVAGDVWLQAAQIVGDCDFSGARIGGEWNAERAHLRRGVWLDGAQVAGAVSLRSAKIDGPLTLNDAHFKASFWARGLALTTVDARNAAFDADAGFGGAIIAGPARFASARFGGHAGFGETVFKDAADFANARFAGSAWFEGAQFLGPADFSLARFAGPMRFEGITVADDAPTVRAHIDQIRKAFGG
jgi:hypothetical protein